MHLPKRYNATTTLRRGGSFLIQEQQKSRAIVNYKELPFFPPWGTVKKKLCINRGTIFEDLNWRRPGEIASRLASLVEKFIAPKCINSVPVSPITREGACTSISLGVTNARGVRFSVRVVSSLFPLLFDRSYLRLAAVPGPPPGGSRESSRRCSTSRFGRRTRRCGGIRCESCPVQIPIRTINNALAARKLQAQLTVFSFTSIPA